MNYSKITRRLVKNFIIKSLVIINLFSLLYWICVLDYIISWQPVVIMSVNCSFLWLVAYANGYVDGTDRYYERMKKEHPKIAEEYLKTLPVSASVIIKVK